MHYRISEASHVRHGGRRRWKTCPALKSIKVIRLVPGAANQIIHSGFLGLFLLSSVLFIHRGVPLASYIV
ncbi:unnamed protein product [Nezara viridula]|uniref:Uncharacterized protein n=1 Tax=Nezara viridula TaxID=85310 RepID=A0A9P0H234_NEZVI|nr:unnamed protein product [Nezara viridula]